MYNVYYFLIVLSVLLFFLGFFPLPVNVKKFNNDPPTHINNVSLNSDQIYMTDIEKTVIVIIDALRLDFMNPEYMPLTTKITKKEGCFNVVKVETPTVTLPRIKALTAGNVPQFIDLILNLATTDILNDSFIHSAHKKQKKIVFYGDYTWLNLFPNIFTRYEVTNTGFVRDFTEVDVNVTRNVYEELKAMAWDIMILHYAGLDHIGHVHGPFSSLVPAKLREMDNIIYDIYTNMSTLNEKTLLVITGDHGMKDGGGHGGSTFAETHVPLVTIGIKCKNGSLSQTDIPANLAVLLGLNIPSTSIGEIRLSLMQFELEKLLFILRYNTLLLVQKKSVCHDQIHLAAKFHEQYLKVLDKASGLRALELYRNCSKIISEELIKSSVDQNFKYMVISAMIMFNLLLIILRNIIQPRSSYRTFEAIEILSYIFIILVQFLLALSWAFLISFFVLLIYLAVKLIILHQMKVQIAQNMPWFLILFSIIHPFTFLSSSFVEEEHQYWYFLNITFIFINMILILKRRIIHLLAQWLTQLVVLRFLRTLNSTGDQWVNYPDFADWLLRSENFYYFQLFSIFGLVTTYYTLYRLNSKKRVIVNSLNFVILLLVHLFKNFDSGSIFIGQLIWLLILLNFLFCCKTLPTVIWILISALLLRPHNVVLIAYCIYASTLFTKEFKTTETIILAHTWLGNMLYFTQGHSNSLASVDLSVGFVGLNEYQPLLVFPQVLCHTYSLPTLCYFLALRNPHIDKNKAWNIMFLIRLFVMLVTCLVTVVQRYHLFIWSVFAPKLFIETIHTLILFVGYSIYIVFTVFYMLYNKVKLLN